MEIFTFTDLIDPNETGTFLVKAELKLFTTEEGGRKSAVRSMYRPNHNFGDPKNREFYIGQIDFLESEEMNLGETAIVNIIFIKGRGLKELLTIGRKWRIQEGARQVGEATVLEVKDEI